MRRLTQARPDAAGHRRHRRDVCAGADRRGARGRELCEGRGATASACRSSRCTISAGISRPTIWRIPDLEPPFLCLVVSGGHTLIVDVQDYTKFHILGTTRDDAAGECFDKIARVIGMPYPGGAALDQTAQTGDENKYPMPHTKLSGNPLDMSFSGLKTAALNLIHTHEQTRRGAGYPVALRVVLQGGERYARAADDAGPASRPATGRWPSRAAWRQIPASAGNSTRRTPGARHPAVHAAPAVSAATTAR